MFGRFKAYDEFELTNLELVSKVLFATKSSIKLQINEIGNVDLSVPTDFDVVGKHPIKLRTQPHVGNIAIHNETDGNYDVFAAMQLNEQYFESKHDTFPVAVFEAIRDVLKIPNESAELYVTKFSGGITYSFGTPKHST